MLCDCGNQLFHVICMKNIGVVELKCSECGKIKEIHSEPHVIPTLLVRGV